MPILSAKHTHEELRDTPIVDSTCCVLMANNEIILDLLENDEFEQAKHVAAWHIWAAKAYGIKAVNPGGVAAWKWGKDCKGLSDVVPGYKKVTPAKIDRGARADRRRPEPAAPAPPPLQQPRRAGQLHDDPRDDEDPGRPAGAHGPPAVPRLRRRRLVHDEVGREGDRRVLQRAPEPDLRRRRGAVRQHRDRHRRRPVAAPALRTHRPQVGQPRRRERDRLRRRALRLQGEEPRQRGPVGGRAGTAAAHRRPVAHLPHHRPPQRRDLLALPGDHATADERRLPQGATEAVPGEDAEPHRAAGTRRASTRSSRSRSSRRPGRRGRSA